MLKKIWSLVRSYYRLQRVLRYVRPFMPARVRWKRITANFTFPRRPANAKKILLATSTGAHWVMSGFESVLGASLKLRGAHVDVLLCDGVLPACQECDLRLFPNNSLLKKTQHPLCQTCFKPARTLFSELNIPVLTYSKYLSKEDQQEIEKILVQINFNEIKDLSWRGISVGEHAYAGTLRFFGRGDLNGESSGSAVLKRYLHAALLTTAIMQCLLKTHSYEAVVFHHGIYVPQGVVGEVCRQAGVRVINWHPAYRNRTYLFSHGDTYHKTMIDEAPEEWENLIWSEEKDQMLMHYLESRQTGSNDWISFQRSDPIVPINWSTLGLKSQLPTIGLLTNVLWDAQLHFQHNAFSSMQEWLFFTIDYFINRPHLQLIIRIHPAEVLGGVPSRQRVEEEIHARYPNLTSNICIISAESTINTYSVMHLCDTVLAYGTKMATELPCWGIPVVVAGEAWARGKGFTIDVSSAAEFHQVLETLPQKKRLDQEKIIRARKYAYHFFYRRMIPVKFARRFPRLVPFAYDIASMDALMPGADDGLDIICKGILTGQAFTFTA